MSDKDKYVSNLEGTLKRYDQKLSKLSKALDRYPESEKDNIRAEMDNIKDKFKDAEKMFQDLKYATEENWETLKDTSAEVFKALKESFHELSGYMSMDQIGHVKDEVIDFGHEKMNELSECIKKKPFTAAFWALGIGFVLGKMMTGSKK